MTENTTTVLALWRACRAALEAAGIENAAAETDWLWQAAVGSMPDTAHTVATVSP